MKRREAERLAGITKKKKHQMRRNLLAESEDIDETDDFQLQYVMDAFHVGNVSSIARSFGSFGIYSLIRLSNLVDSVCQSCVRWSERSRPLRLRRRSALHSTTRSLHLCYGYPRELVLSCSFLPLSISHLPLYAVSLETRLRSPMPGIVPCHLVKLCKNTRKKRTRRDWSRLIRAIVSHFCLSRIHQVGGQTLKTW